MHKYILKRLLMLIPVVVGITFLVFFILSLTPGDPVNLILGDSATPEAKAILREQLGLNDPLLVQYGKYMFKMVQGDFGRSYTNQRDVMDEIAQRFPLTFLLAICSTAISITIAIPLGIISAIKQYSVLDTASMVFCLLGVSMPNFWLGLMLILIFSLRLGWLPAIGFDSAKSLILPSLTLGIGGAANIARMMRASMLEVIRQDYIRTAKAKGVKKNKVIIKHALRNAMMPVLTIIGLQFGLYLGGAALSETVFSLPGTGRLMLDGIKSRDTPVVLGCIIVFALLYSLVNLLVDILYGFVDTRIRAEYR